jgi:maleylpyruvate isomerase
VDDRAWIQHFLPRGLTALERVVQETAGKFCVGDAPSFADVYLVPQLYGARRFKIDLAPFPTLVRIDAACEALPAFQAAHPDRQPDAEPAPR